MSEYVFRVSWGGIDQNLLQVTPANIAQKEHLLLGLEQHRVQNASPTDAMTKPQQPLFPATKTLHVLKLH